MYICITFLFSDLSVSRERRWKGRRKEEGEREEEKMRGNEKARERQAKADKSRRGAKHRPAISNYLIFFERWKAHGRVTILSEEKLQTKCLQKSISKTKKII